MLSTTYLRLLPTLTFYNVDVAKLLLSSQNATQFYLQYFSNREVVLNEHSVEISTDGQTTTFVDDNPDRSVTCLALFVTSFRFSIDISDLKDFFIFLGRAKRLTTLVTDCGQQNAGVRDASNYLENESWPKLKTVAGPPKLFCPTQKLGLTLNSFETVIFTDAHSLPHGTMGSFIRSISQPAFHAKKMIWNFDAITMQSMTASLNRCTEPRNDVEELTIKLKRHRPKGIKAFTESVLRVFPKLKRFDCYFVVPYVDDTEADDCYTDDLTAVAMAGVLFVDDAKKKLINFNTSHTAVNFFCHNDYALKVFGNPFGFFDFFLHDMVNFKLDKIVDEDADDFDPYVSRFKFENVQKQVPETENMSFDLRLRGKIVDGDNSLF